MICNGKALYLTRVSFRQLSVVLDKWAPRDLSFSPRQVTCKTLIIASYFAKLLVYFSCSDDGACDLKISNAILSWTDMERSVLFYNNVPRIEAIALAVKVHY